MKQDKRVERGMSDDATKVYPSLRYLQDMAWGGAEDDAPTLVERRAPGVGPHVADESPTLVRPPRPARAMESRGAGAVRRAPSAEVDARVEHVPPPPSSRSVLPVAGPKRSDSETRIAIWTDDLQRRGR